MFDADANELLPIFILEIQEHLESYDDTLLRLESEPGDARVLAELFRILHTIKGGCSLFGFNRLSRLVHHAENLAAALRSGQLNVTPDVLSALFASGDTLRHRLIQIQETGKEPAQDDTALADRLEALLTTPQTAVVLASEVKEHKPVEAPAYQTTEPKSETTALAAKLPPDPAAGNGQPKNQAAIQTAIEEGESASELKTASQAHAFAVSVTAQNPNDAAFIPNQSNQSNQGSVSEILPDAPPGDDTLARRNEGLLHVDVQLLNRLLDRSSELLLLRHAFFRATPGTGEMSARDYQQLCQRYQGLALELQESLLQVRMQPIGQLWKTYPRLIRDLGQRTGKQLQLVTVGEETELDKAILEAIRDPLVHLLRNAVDHGFETPDARQALGKPAQGSLRLSAYQDEGSIFVSLEDDGRGLDYEAIKSRGIERGLITAERAAQSSEEDFIQLLFEPGFSTATKVTDLSGRGVGMDVVRTNLAQIGGSIDVFSQSGVGTRFTMRLPLTLTLLPALLLKQGGQQLALPQHHLKEILTRSQLEELSLGERPFCRWRGQTLPLGFLGELMGSGATESNFIVVLQGKRRFALAIEDVTEIQEVAVKPLSSHWENYPLLAGASLLGSGQLTVVLSLSALEAKICREDADARTQTLPLPLDVLDASSALLLCEALGGGQLALPLTEVEALDDLKPEQLLNLPGSEIVSRRGEIVPVLDIGAALAGRPPQRQIDKACSLVICERDGRRLGLLVAQVIDIVADQVQAEGPALRGGISRTALLAEGPVEVLEPSYVWSRLETKV